MKNQLSLRARSDLYWPWGNRMSTKVTDCHMKLMSHLKYFVYVFGYPPLWQY